MKKMISVKVAGNILLSSLALLAVFHVLVLLNVVPSTIVWGGQVAGSPTILLALELIALVVTLFFVDVVAAKLGYIQLGKFQKATKIGVWLIFAYLILNTVGNLAAHTSFESLIFAPITLFLALCALRLAIEP